MKLTDKLASRTTPRPFHTFEFFPPRTDQGFDNLVSRIARLSALHPLAISITWGAGGATRERSLELAGLTQELYGIDTILHLTCTNMEQGTVDDVLHAAKAKGIQNILALRGDPPRGQEDWLATDARFAHGIDLVRYIRASPEFSAAFCVGVAAYPDGHPDQLLDERAELAHLQQKVDAGADFVVTQLFYDVDGFLRWQARVRARGITVPIIPGIMPLQTYSSFLRLTKLCGTRVPDHIEQALEPIKNDDQKVKDYGATLATEMVRRLTTEGGVPGVHFCTLNLEKSVQRVLESLGWVTEHKEVLNKLIAEENEAPEGSELLVSASSATSDITATHNAAVAAARPKSEGSNMGRGAATNVASWDEFPNGRFGDYKSPAYGDTDQWGGPALPRSAAFSEWGAPATEAELTALFAGYLSSRVASTPFSPLPLSAESATILEHLQALTARGLWTVGSQPAVDGASSGDAVVGWGPRGGYVFQKGFVEFFAGADYVARIERKVMEEGGGWVDYFAARADEECRTNVPYGGRNAVTWGVFPGQEIVQTTIIEEDSFLSWKDEAFGIWSEWATFFAPDSPSRALLAGIARERWLVSIVHHDYKRPDALWRFLFEGRSLEPAAE